ncbi:hypothetical protein FQZ97_706350 [compost metagenome]
MEVFDIGSKRVSCQGGLNAIDPFPSILNYYVPNTINQVSIITGTADHSIVAGTAIQPISPYTTI